MVYWGELHKLTLFDIIYKICCLLNEKALIIGITTRWIISYLYYNLSPFNEQMIKRKLQIQTRLSDRFKDQHHRMTKDELFDNRKNHYLPFISDLSSDINRLVSISYHNEI